MYIGIEAVAAVIATHPSLTEVLIDNQKAPVSRIGERALIQALYNNIIIIKLSYTFNDPTYKHYCALYLHRNLELKHLNNMAEKTGVDGISGTSEKSGLDGILDTAYTAATKAALLSSVPSPEPLDNISASIGISKTPMLFDAARTTGRIYTYTVGKNNTNSTVYNDPVQYAEVNPAYKMKDKKTFTTNYQRYSIIHSRQTPDGGGSGSGKEAVK